ncbi:hypothetical protein JAAARDRAFT_30966 [Jaapia argillacea MUCL 33604]|uniref:Uncharacterized protein n=1 Tax=Jaapia argillacea MUCL 33604 TaxID=933084 RepID=A0A067QDF1_9AGAM|nr:hypothetical protein JAAARDRAFT_30966 [Jaapia argillacea MUCL 33604]
MEDTSSSPERSVPSRSPVKVTYSSRQKKSLNANDPAEDSPDEPNDAKPLVRKASSVEASPGRNNRAGGKPAPKKVDVHLPGPAKLTGSPSLDHASKKPASKSGKTLHVRASSIASLKNEARKDSPSPKPPSVIARIGKPVSKRKGTPSVQPQDNPAAEAESSKAKPTRRNESQRMQVLEDDPNCTEFEEHRARCASCSNWINLGKRQTYCLKPWTKHQLKCSKANESNQEPEQASDNEDDDASTAAPSIVSEQSVRTRRSEPERKAFLEADPRVEEFKDHEVLCKGCHKWIKLSTKQRYALYNWQNHQQRCSGAVPSSRVATAERKLKLVNDSQVKSFTVQAIECFICSQTVQLEGADYDLTKWEEHKEHCNKSILEAQELAQVPLDDTSPPPPVEESGPSPGPSSPNKGLKRSFDADEEEEEPRPPNRPRTDEYEPPEGEARGPWGWFILPFQTFVRGFREGLNGAS